MSPIVIEISKLLKNIVLTIEFTNIQILPSVKKYSIMASPQNSLTESLAIKYYFCIIIVQGIMYNNWMSISYVD